MPQGMRVRPPLEAQKKRKRQFTPQLYQTNMSKVFVRRQNLPFLSRDPKLNSEMLSL
jgi:hypothetical protein